MDNQNQNLDNQIPPVSSTQSTDNLGNGTINQRNSVPAKDFMGTLEYYFVTKAPFQIPGHIRELMVKFMPWINVIFLLTIVPLLLTLIGLNSYLSFITSPYPYHYRWSLSAIISLITFIMGIIALPGLFKRKKTGWNLTFYEVIISFIGSLLNGNIITAIISVVIGFYFLFQIKSYYN